MKAIVRKHYGSPDVLALVSLPDPEPAPGQVLIRVRAFGLNHAELYMRRGEWGEVAAVSGIECVGEVVQDTTGRLPAGQTVMAMMGGMGRSMAGSYAEFTCVPATNVVPLQTTLDWAALAALPMSYAVAWTCLMRNLALRPGQHLLVRGGSASLGQAAVDIAAEMGAEVIATVRHPRHIDTLLQRGASQVLLNDGQPLAETEGWLHPVDAVLDLLGNSTILDSMLHTRRGGHVCLAGFLAGLAPLPAFNPLSQMPGGVQLSFFGSFMFGQPGFELDDIPLQTLVDKAQSGRYHAQPAQVFAFDEIVQAHALMENHQAGGKLVVRL